MFQDKFVFSQQTSFLDRNHFNYLVRKYGGDKYVKHFTCWNQLFALMFGQLSNRDSLRDLIVGLEAHQTFELPKTQREAGPDRLGCQKHGGKQVRIILVGIASRKTNYKTLWLILPRAKRTIKFYGCFRFFRNEP